MPLRRSPPKPVGAATLADYARLLSAIKIAQAEMFGEQQAEMADALHHLSKQREH